ncbi:unnamed protein product [Knipowitschia caucasica]
MSVFPALSRSECSEAQVWERAWTIEEMRQNSTSWSLAADSGLFLFLQDFSQRMLSQTHDMEKQLDALIRDTTATDVCLHSVFNDFIMLSNTQFIENRVYDEEVEDSVPKADVSEPEQEKTREQKEAELIPKMQEAVSYGLKVLESAFEHLDLKAGNSDSEDEEAPDREDAILEPKDLYVDRPLPFLIGSQAFMEQEDVGLGDLSSDEMSVDSDRDSVVETEDGKAAVHSDEDYNQDEEETPELIKKKSSMLSYDDEDEDEDSDIFGDSDKEDEEESKSTQQASFADELAARIKGETKPEADRASLSSKKKSKIQRESKPAPPEDEDSDDMFKPPKMEDEEEEEEDELSAFGGRSGLFSGGRGLFDDDDEGDLFSDAPKPAAAEEEKHIQHVAKTSPPADSTKSGKKVPVGGVSIFPENSLFGSGPELRPELSKENGAPAVRAPPGGGLFDEEDDDFFTGPSVQSSEPVKETKSKRAVDLFEDEDEDLFSDKSSPHSKREEEAPQEKPPQKKMPAGAVSLFGPGTKSLLSEGLKKQQNGFAPESKSSPKPQSRGLFSDDDDNAAVNGLSPEKSSAAKSGGLFSDDEDSVVFPSVPKNQSKPETLNQTRTKKPAVSLFDDEEEEDEEDLFASAAKSKPKALQTKASSTLFSDDEDQWLSSNAEKSSMKSSVSAPCSLLSVSAPCSLPSVTAPVKSDLFDVNEDDLFAPPQDSSQKTCPRVALLFEDEDEDDKSSLFTVKPAASPKASPAPAPKDISDSPSTTTDSAEKPLPPASPPPAEAQTRKRPPGAVSLFGGIDVLPVTQSRRPAEREDLKEDKKEKSKTKTLSLFDDDEKDEPDGNDSIFALPKPTNTTKSSEEKASTKSTGVFQDEELLFSHAQQKDNDPDVDLFSTSGKTAPTSSRGGAGKSSAPSLFSDDDEDDLFSSVKPKTSPLKVAEKKKPVEKAALEKPLEKAALEKAALEKAALEKAALEKAALEKAALEKAALEKAALEKKPVEKAALEKKPVEKAALEKAALEKAALEKAALEKAALEKAALEKAALEKAALEKAALEKAALEKAALEKAALEKAALEKAALEKAALEKAALEKAELEKAELEKAALEKAALEKAALEKAALEKAALEKAALEKAELEKAALEKAETSPEPSSESSASLLINPAALLPGASMSRSSSGMEASSSSGVSSSSLSPSPLTSPLELPRDPDLGVGFDTPAHITTLESAHKSRVKGSSQRRPQSRAARQHSAQKSAPNLGFEPSAQSLSTPVSAATSSPSALTLPVPTDPTDSSKEPPLSQELSFPDEDDIFSSDHLFGASVASTKSQPSPAANEKSRPSPAANEKSRPSPAANEKSQPSPAANEKSRPSPAANEKSQPSPAANEKSRPSPAANEKSQPSPAANEKSRPSPAANEAVVKAEKSVLPSIFDDNMGDLFQKVKTKPAAKKSKPAGFLEEDDDLFGSSSAPAAKSSFSNTDIFQDAVDPGPKAQRKHKEKKIESSLFHDNVDIFADLSDTFKPKHKVKTKAEAKSIFDDDMDDIFSSSTVTAKPPLQQKKTSARPDPSTDATDIFDDPLNALGGM